MQNIYSWMVVIFWNELTCAPRFSSICHASIVSLYTNLLIVLVRIQHSFSLQQLLMIVRLAVLAVLLVTLTSHVLWPVAVDILWHFKHLAARKGPLINTVYWTFQQRSLLFPLLDKYNPNTMYSTMQKSRVTLHCFVFCKKMGRSCSVLFKDVQALMEIQ